MKKFKDVKIGCIKVFIISFCIMLIIQLPDMIVNSGYFVYGGDYSMQMIPFYRHGVETVRNGAVGWDWITGLGTDFIGSYGYYFFGSPFFWIMCLLSEKFTIIIMPFMTALKVGVAAVTAYIYIKRYIKDYTITFICAFMYAFSGYQLYNLVYYFFNDVTALFPLLLLSFDKLVKEDKRGFFALMTAVMAFTNYYFFFGQVIFVVIYYIVGCVTKEFKFTLKSFGLIAFEAILGVTISCIILVPTIITVMSGSRISDVLCGVDLVSYSDNTIIPKIVQSLFIPPDSPSYAQLFLSSDNTHNWASISLYIPFFASVGVFSYIVANKKSYISILLIICSIMSCVPVLNSMFYMFNSSYYARWFYMPVLFMCIATGKCLDDNVELRPGIIFHGIGLFILSVIALFPDEKFSTEQMASQRLGLSLLSDTQNEISFFKMCKSPITFWQNIAFGVISLLLIFVYIKQRENDKKILKKFSVIIVSFTAVISFIYVDNTEGILDVNDYDKKAIDFKPVVESNDEFYRVSDSISSGRISNLNIMWNMNAINTFHSIAPASVDKFFMGVRGKPRMMGARYGEEDYAVLGLLSHKYAFSESTNDELNVENYHTDINGFELYDKQGYYYVYENKHFIPMGFMYDYYISQSDIDKFLSTVEFSDEDEKYRYKQLIMMRALILGDEDSKKYSGILNKISDDMMENLNEDSYYADCEDRSNMSCCSFEYNEDGFCANINSDNTGLLFFSVPYSEGWTAEVNGEKTDIVISHYGLMSVMVEEGENNVIFSYETPGLKVGTYMTVAGILILALYVVFCFRMKRHEG